MTMTLDNYGSNTTPSDRLLLVRDGLVRQFEPGEALIAGDLIKNTGSSHAELLLSQDAGFASTVLLQVNPDGFVKIGQTQSAIATESGLVVTTLEIEELDSAEVLEEDETGGFAGIGGTGLLATSGAGAGAATALAVGGVALLAASAFDDNNSSASTSLQPNESPTDAPAPTPSNPSPTPSETPTQAPTPTDAPTPDNSGGNDGDQSGNSPSPAPAPGNSPSPTPGNDSDNDEVTMPPPAPAPTEGGTPAIPGLPGLPGLDGLPLGIPLGDGEISGLSMPEVGSLSLGGTSGSISGLEALIVNPDQGSVTVLDPTIELGTSPGTRAVFVEDLYAVSLSLSNPEAQIGAVIDGLSALPDTLAGAVGQLATNLSTQQKVAVDIPATQIGGLAGFDRLSLDLSLTNVTDLLGDVIDVVVSLVNGTFTADQLVLTPGNPSGFGQSLPQELPALNAVELNVIGQALADGGGAALQDGLTTALRTVQDLIANGGGGLPPLDPGMLPLDPGMLPFDPTTLIPGGDGGLPLDPGMLPLDPGMLPTDPAVITDLLNPDNLPFDPGMLPTDPTTLIPGGDGGLPFDPGMLPLDPGMLPTDPAVITDLLNPDNLPFDPGMLPTDPAVIADLLNPDNLPFDPGMLPTDPAVITDLLNPDNLPFDPGMLPLDPGMLPFDPTGGGAIPIASNSTDNTLTNFLDLTN